MRYIKIKQSCIKRWHIFPSYTEIEWPVLINFHASATDEPETPA
jgi:hypothetical protein